jgi:hypothetical protein
MFDTADRVGRLGPDFVNNVSIERIVYESVEAMLADGWEVD